MPTKGRRSAKAKQMLDLKNVQTYDHKDEKLLFRPLAFRRSSSGRRLQKALSLRSELSWVIEKGEPPVKAQGRREACYYYRSAIKELVGTDEGDSRPR